METILIIAIIIMAILCVVLLVAKDYYKEELEKQRKINDIHKKVETSVLKEKVYLQHEIALYQDTIEMYKKQLDILEEKIEELQKPNNLLKEGEEKKPPIKHNDHIDALSTLYTSNPYFRENFFEKAYFDEMAELVDTEFIKCNPLTTSKKPNYEFIHVTKLTDKEKKYKFIFTYKNIDFRDVKTNKKKYCIHEIRALDKKRAKALFFEKYPEAVIHGILEL